MQKSILPFLKCVDCGNNLLDIVALKESKEAGEFRYGKLICEQCGMEFPVYDYIPILVSKNVIRSILPRHIFKFCHDNDIKISSQSDKSQNSIITSKSAKNWEFQWSKTKGMFSDKNNYFLSEKAYLDFILIKKEEYAKKDIFVVGTGYGKEIAHIKNYNCKNIFAVDISPTLYLAQKRFKQKNMHYIIADIMNLPFAENFDIVIADHVLHNLVDTEKATKQLINLVKPEGIFAANYYSYENNFLMHSIIEPFKKYFLRFFPLIFIYYFSLLPGLLIYIYIIIIKNISRFFPRGVKAPPLSRLVNYWAKIPFTWFWRAAIFDLLQAPVAGYYTRNKVLSILFPRQASKINLHAQTMWCIRLDNK